MISMVLVHHSFDTKPFFPPQISFIFDDGCTLSPGNNNFSDNYKAEFNKQIQFTTFTLEACLLLSLSFIAC